MRKRLVCWTAACLLLLGGCGASGAGEDTQGYTEEQAQEILDGGVSR